MRVLLMSKEQVRVRGCENLSEIRHKGRKKASKLTIQLFEACICQSNSLWVSRTIIITWLAHVSYIRQSIVANRSCEGLVTRGYDSWPSPKRLKRGMKLQQSCFVGILDQSSLKRRRFEQWTLDRYYLASYSEFHLHIAALSMEL
jgi:hypothetical protein